MRRILTFVLGMSVVSTALFASIRVAPPNPLPGQEVQFTIQPTAGAPVVRVRWTFGDGSPFVDSTGPVMKHTFFAAGSYVVTASYSGPADRVTVVVAERRRITYAPAQPLINVVTTFRAENFFGSCVAWNMGDGTAYPSGTPTQRHTYRTLGTYTVTAVENCGRDLRYSFQTRVQVSPNQGPQAPFNISYIVLRFADGQTSASVAQDFSPLVAYADLKFEGTGTLVAEWLVDGQPVATSTVPLSFANQTTLNSGPVPPLPTQTAGRHRVSLRILRPNIDLRIPEIEYIVTLGRGPAPLVASAQPDVLSRDKEYALILRGREFTASTKFDFGSDISVVSPPVVRSAEEAEVRIFVSRTAKDGERPVGRPTKTAPIAGPAGSGSAWPSSSPKNRSASNGIVPTSRPSPKAGSISSPPPWSSPAISAGRTPCGASLPSTISPFSNGPNRMRARPTSSNSGSSTDRGKAFFSKRSSRPSPKAIARPRH